MYKSVLKNALVLYVLTSFFILSSFTTVVFADDSFVDAIEDSNTWGIVLEEEDSGYSGEIIGGSSEGEVTRIPNIVHITTKNATEKSIILVSII